MHILAIKTDRRRDFGILTTDGKITLNGCYNIG
jgi:hypothetical protein